jgi:anti-anti-sigma regulatory factor
MDTLSPERHALVLHRSSAWQHSRIMAWVTDALARGDKVLHRSADPAALLDALGRDGQAALAAGRLEIVDAHRSHTETDGLHRALSDLHEEQVRAAFDAGFSTVLLTADDEALRVMLPEPAELLEYENDLDRLAAMPGVRVLCCYDLRTERDDVLESTAATHYRSVDDTHWSARLSGDRLLLRGEIDVDNAGRVSAVLRAAAARGIQAVDLSEVTVLSAAGVRAFDDAVAVLRPGGDRLLLAGPSPTVRNALVASGATTRERDEVLELIGPTADELPGVRGEQDDSHLASLARELSTLSTLLLEGPTVATVLSRIVDVAREVVPAADIVSVTLRAPDGTFHTPIKTDEIAERLDGLQYELDEGPCLDAARVVGANVAVSEDLAHGSAWPRFGPAAAELGMRSLVATAVLPDAEPPRLSGALNLYSRTAGAFTAADCDVALVLAGHASLALVSTQALTLQELEAEQLRRAIDTRDVIGQAKGILMQRRGISADEAFDLLRVLSQQLNVRVSELAATLAEHRGELDVAAAPAAVTEAPVVTD